MADARPTANIMLAMDGDHPTTNEVGQFLESMLVSMQIRLRVDAEMSTFRVLPSMESRRLPGASTNLGLAAAMGAHSGAASRAEQRVAPQSFEMMPRLGDGLHHPPGSSGNTGPGQYNLYGVPGHLAASPARELDSGSSSWAAGALRPPASTSGYGGYGARGPGGSGTLKVTVVPSEGLRGHHAGGRSWGHGHTLGGSAHAAGYEAAAACRAGRGATDEEALCSEEQPPSNTAPLLMVDEAGAVVAVGARPGSTLLAAQGLGLHGVHVGDGSGRAGLHALMQMTHGRALAAARHEEVALLDARTGSIMTAHAAGGGPGAAGGAASRGGSSTGLVGGMGAGGLAAGLASPLLSPGDKVLSVLGMLGASTTPGSSLQGHTDSDGVASDRGSGGRARGAIRGGVAAQSAGQGGAGIGSATAPSQTQVGLKPIPEMSSSGNWAVDERPAGAHRPAGHQPPSPLNPHAHTAQQQQQHSGNISALLPTHKGGSPIRQARRGKSGRAAPGRSPTWYGGAPPGLHPDPKRAIPARSLHLRVCRAAWELLGGLQELRPLVPAGEAGGEDEDEAAVEVEPARAATGGRAGRRVVRPVAAAAAGGWTPAGGVGGGAAGACPEPAAAGAVRSVVLQGRWGGDSVVVKVLGGPGLDPQAPLLRDAVSAAAAVHPGLVRVLGVHVLPAAAGAGVGAAGAGSGSTGAPGSGVPGEGTAAAAAAGREAMWAAVRPGGRVLAGLERGLAHRGLHEPGGHAAAPAAREEGGAGAADGPAGRGRTASHPPLGAPPAPHAPHAPAAHVSGGGDAAGPPGAAEPSHAAGLALLAPLALRPGDAAVAVIMEHCALGSLAPLATLASAPSATAAALATNPFRPSRTWPAYMARRALLTTALEVAGGLARLHEYGIAHGGLTPGNVLRVPALMDQRRFCVKVSDVCLSASLLQRCCCGAPHPTVHPTSTCGITWATPVPRMGAGAHPPTPNRTTGAPLNPEEHLFTAPELRTARRPPSGAAAGAPRGAGARAGGGGRGGGDGGGELCGLSAEAEAEPLPPAPAPTPAADVWAFGALLYSLVAGHSVVSGEVAAQQGGGANCMGPVIGGAAGAAAAAFAAEEAASPGARASDGNGGGVGGSEEQQDAGPGAAVREVAPPWPGGAHPHLRQLYEWCMQEQPDVRPSMEQVVWELTALEQGLRSDRPKGRAVAAATLNAISSMRARD